MVLPSGELHIKEVGPEDGYKSYQCRTKHRLTGETRLSATKGRLVITGKWYHVKFVYIFTKYINFTKNSKTIVSRCVSINFQKAKNKNNRNSISQCWMLCLLKTKNESCLFKFILTCTGKTLSVINLTSSCDSHAKHDSLLRVTRFLSFSKDILMCKSVVLFNMKTTALHNSSFILKPNKFEIITSRLMQRR